MAQLHHRKQPPGWLYYYTDNIMASKKNQAMLCEPQSTAPSSVPPIKKQLFISAIDSWKLCLSATVPSGL